MANIIQQVIEFSVKNLGKIQAGVGLLSKSISETDKEVKKLNTDLEKTINVSDELGDSIKDVSKKTKSLGTIFKESQKVGEKAFNNLIKGAKDFVTESKAYKKVSDRVSSFTKRIDAATGASSKLAKVTSAFGAIKGFAKAGGDATGLTKAFGGVSKGIGFASKAFGVLGKAIIGTGIGLLVPIVIKLTEKLLQNEKVISAMNKAFAVLEGVLNPLVDIIVELGEKFFTALSKPKETLDSIVKFIKEDVLGLFIDLGKLIKAVFSGEFETAGKIFDKYKKIATDGYNAIKEGVKSYIKSAKEAAEANLQYQASIEKNIVLLRELTKAQAAYASAAEATAGIVDDATLSFETREKALNSFLEIQKKQLKAEADIARITLENAKLQQKISNDQSQETKDNIASLEAANITAQSNLTKSVREGEQKRRELQTEGILFNIDLKTFEAEKLADINQAAAESGEATIESSRKLAEEAFNVYKKFAEESIKSLDENIPEQLIKIKELQAELLQREQDYRNALKGIRDKAFEEADKEGAARLAKEKENFDVINKKYDEQITKINEQKAKAGDIKTLRFLTKQEEEVIEQKYEKQVDFLKDSAQIQIGILKTKKKELEADTLLLENQKKQIENGTTLLEADKNKITLLNASIEKNKELSATIDDQTKVVQENLDKTTDAAKAERDAANDRNTDTVTFGNSLDGILSKLSGGKIGAKLDKLKANIFASFQAAQEVLGAAADATNAIFERQAAALDKQIESSQEKIDTLNTGAEDSLAKQEALESKLADARDGQRKRLLKSLELEKRRNAEIQKQKIKEQEALKAAEEEKRAIQTKNAKAQKAFAIVQSIIGTALSVMQALAGSPPPASYILAAASGVAGAVQTALIASQPIPEFAEGGFTAKGGKYQPAGIVHAGEYVVPKSIVENPKYSDKVMDLENIRQGKSQKYSMPGYASGGFVTPAPVTTTPSIGTNNTSMFNEQFMMQAQRTNELLNTIAQKSNVVSVLSIQEENAKVNKIKSLATVVS